MSRDGSESEFTSPPLLVSTLGIHVKPQFRTAAETIVVNAGTIKKEISRTISAGSSHQELFDPPLEIPLHTKVLISIHYRSFFRASAVTLSLDPKMISSEADEKDGKQVYRRTEKNIEVSLGIQSLPPTVSEIVASCSRFRVLIIGKSGVGKSSLINKVFGVSRVDVSNTTRGEARIDQEHIAPDNERFVVHDSCGFEAGDHRNFEDACNFIRGRRCRGNLKDQLHAVWLCLEIPFAGGRVLETGVEEFLKDRDRILGNIPLVVVFTKVDSLENILYAQALQAGKPLDTRALGERKREALDKYCLEPIRRAMDNNDVPSIAVSTREGYENSLSELVEKTTMDIQKRLKNEAAHYIATMAQRVNITLKIEAIIALGEKRYWTTLKESPSFRGQPMKACFDVLHRDIVTVWNFKDPQHSLYGEEFKRALLKTSKGTQNPVQSSASVVAALVSAIGLAKTTGATVMPATGTIVRCKLDQDRYAASQDIVRQLMTYIVDLTCVMQILLLLIVVRDGEASPEAAYTAIEAYNNTYRPNVHHDISNFPVTLRIVPKKQDEVLDKIKELIGKYRIPDEDVVRFRRELQSAGVASA